MSTPPDTSFPPAKLFKRLFSFVYDLFILFALSMAYSAVATTIMVNAFGVANTGDYKPMQSPWFGFGWVLCICVFYWFFWRRAGQTVGMRAWRLKLVSADATPLTSKQLAIRILVAPLSLGAGGLGYFWCLLNAKKLAWHDLASGTQVIQLPKPEKKNKK